MYCLQCTSVGVKLHLQNTLFFPHVREQQYG